MAADGFGLKYDNLPIQKILQTATLTVAFAPMLAILFLAYRLRVNQLTKNKGDPPERVRKSPSLRWGPPRALLEMPQ